MVRREYVSFLRERRQDIGFGDRGPDPSRWLWLILAVGIVGLSVWWFGFRNADEVASAERILDDTTIPSLLIPSAIDEQGGPVLAASLECGTLVDEWTTFQGGPHRTGCLTTRPITSPDIMWHVETGIQGWRNNPVIEDGAIFVGSAGITQFSRDRRDGIYSFALTDGNQRWFYTTELDVNGVAVSDGVVVGTGDEGRIWALSARDGSLLWTDDLGVGVFGDPLILGDLVVIGDGAGLVTAYDIEDGERLWQRGVSGPVRGGASSDGERIFVAGEARDVLALDMDGQQLWRAEVTARGSNPDRAKIFAAPTVTETMVLISLVRNDVEAEPALLALDKETGELIWRARDAAGIKTQWANVRSSPAVVGDFVVYGEGYSEEIIVLDLATGETVWSLPVGEFCYPHWPSAAVNNGVAYLARHDGALYAVSLESQEIVWDLYLGDADGTGAFPADFDSGFCDWGPETGFSILASPAVSPEGVIVVGTLEGVLLAIGDSEWDS